jgi:hypothetical protein
MATLGKDFAGTWSAFGDDMDVYEALIEAEDDNDDVPSLMSDYLDLATELEADIGYVDEVVEKKQYVVFEPGLCRAKATILHQFEDDDDEPDADAIYVVNPPMPDSAEDPYNLKHIIIPATVLAMAVATTKSVDVGFAWDMYDSGASHHMLLSQTDFMAFTEIELFSLTATNREAFVAIGIGGLLVSVPNGNKSMKMKFTCVLYTPTIGFTLISVGCIDDTGYFSLFGNGKCQLSSPDGKVIGTIPKTGGLYRTEHISINASANYAVRSTSLKDLHVTCGHISAHALKDLYCHGLFPDIQLTDLSTNFEC